jgi:RNA polymerase sigma-70 factor (ECF subfamily)
VELFLLTREEWAFKLLYQRHSTMLWRLVLRLVQANREAAEDILQDVWLRSIEKLPQFRWDSSLRTWLTGIALLRVREHWRSSKLAQVRQQSMEVLASMAIWPDQDLVNQDVLAKIESLPTGFRTILILHDQEGFKHEEIAELLNISVGTSKSQLSRARQLLRKKLA